MQYTHFKFFWLIPFEWASLGAFTNLNAMVLDCSTLYAPGAAMGMPCNAYNTTSINSTFKTCNNDRVCKPYAFSNCIEQCIHDASFVGTNHPSSGPSCNVSGDPGVRCDEFRELSAQPAQPGIFSPAVIAGQQNKAQGTSGWQAVGAVIPTPILPNAAYATKLQSLGSKTKASDPAQEIIGIKEARRCPLLVRVGIEVSCLAASSIRVHIRVEQGFQIAGEAPVIALDTVLDRKAAVDILVRQPFRQKNGGECLPGMVNG